MILPSDKEKPNAKGIGRFPDYF